ncbi:MAG TPA: caspase family protein [Polyangia bacterium]|nr:caspase family protein [Polyangia bacterium]
MIFAGTALVPALLLTARIAIVSSSSQADGQLPLRYADRDAQRTAAVLRELGAFDPADIWVLPQTSQRALRDALDRAEGRAAREPGSTIVLYYSGHADPEGLLLGGERFTYLELRQRLAASKAQIRVAILDACNSGGATRPKGGKASGGPPFAAVEPVRVQGAAILASSAAGELAQESNEIDGSFFTHHFISGLRGAGDRDGDGKVTLGEAYAYAYTRTIAATVSTLWGTQHPSYDYRLSGTGDLVLTTLARERQGITFAPGAHDHYAVLNQAREAVAEVQSDPQRPVRLMLPPGRYRVARRASGRLFAADVDLHSDSDTIVEPTTLREVGPELASAKGGFGPPRHALFADYALVGRSPAGGAVSAEVGLGYQRNWARWSLAPRLSYGDAGPDDKNLSYRLRRFTASLYVLRRIPVGAFDLQLGGAGTLTFADQQLADGRSFDATVPGLAAALAVELPLGSTFAIRLAWDAGAELVPIDGTWSVHPALRGALGVEVRP